MFQASIQTKTVLVDKYGICNLVIKNITKD